MTVTDSSIAFDWDHHQYQDQAAFTGTYGFSGSQEAVNLEGIRMRPADGRAADTLMVFMHPASTLQLRPVPRAMAASGAHVLCAGSRYQRNDAALVMEKVLLLYRRLDPPVPCRGDCRDDAVPLESSERPSRYRQIPLHLHVPPRSNRLHR